MDWIIRTWRHDWKLSDGLERFNMVCFAVQLIAICISAVFIVLTAFTMLYAGTVTTTYDPDEFEIVRKSKGAQFVPYNSTRVTQFQVYSTQSYRDLRRLNQLDN